MPGFTTIADVSVTLRRILQDGMNATFSGGDMVAITLDPPKQIEDDNRSQDRLLSLHLCKIMENADLKNQPPAIIDANSRKRPPLTFDLLYMMIPYGTDEMTKLTILGRAMQILYDQSILQGALLRDSTALQNLEGSSEQIRMSMTPLTQEIITQIWQAMEISMRLAVFYLVTPVAIDSSLSIADVPVKEREARR